MLATLALLGEQPGGTTVIGIEPMSLETNLGLTPEVERRLPEVLEMVKGELSALGVNLAART